MAASNLNDVIMRDTSGSRPAAGIPGRVYYETDTGLLWRDNGDAWEAMSAVSSDGWISSGSMVYFSADAPSYVVTMAGDKSGIYQAGQRIKLNHDGSTKYFIVTKVETSGSTALTLYGGTDYVLSGSPITNPYYSLMKAPFGFPLDPTKWTVEFINTNLSNQDTPAQNTWYNLGSNSLTIPIGIWDVSYSCNIGFQEGSALVQVQVTLSTSGSTESDTYYTSHVRGYASTGNYMDVPVYNMFFISLPLKTIYYMLARTLQTNVDKIRFVNAQYVIIRAKSSYL
jgi:hypothetical protein